MTEQQPREVVEQHQDFAVCRYPAHVVAEVSVRGSVGGAGNQAFRLLFGYISGKNTAQQSMEMTSPVVQQSASEKIAMTSPVVQAEAADGEYVVAFVLPESMSEDNAPVPANPEVTVRTVPERLSAAVSYAGRWSESGYRRHLAKLEKAVTAVGLELVGSPRWARFDPPLKPWFLRRNEVLQDVKPRSQGPTCPSKT